MTDARHLYSTAYSAFFSSATNNSPSMTSFHSSAETMLSLAFNITWVIGSFHLLLFVVFQIINKYYLTTFICNFSHTEHTNAMY